MKRFGLLLCAILLAIPACAQNLHVSITELDSSALYVQRLIAAGFTTSRIETTVARAEVNMNAYGVYLSRVIGLQDSLNLKVDRRDTTSWLPTWADINAKGYSTGGGGDTTSLGYYNVLSYGAHKDDATDDGPHFQAAVNAAVAAQGGTVYIPDGFYHVATSCSLKTYCSVLMGDHAHLRVDAGYTGSVFNMDGVGSVANVTVTGGHIYEGWGTPQGLWTAIEVKKSGSGNWVERCHFYNMEIQNAKYAINIECDDYGYFNSNTFDNIKFENPYSAVRTRSKGYSIDGSDIAGNFWTNCRLQGGSRTRFGIDSLATWHNTFIDFMTWDFTWACPNRISTVTISSYGSYSLLWGGFSSVYNFVDLGSQNTLLADGAFVTMNLAIPTYADMAAAKSAGLAAGKAFSITSTGVVMRVTP